MPMGGMKFQSGAGGRVRKRIQARMKGGGMAGGGGGQIPQWFRDFIKKAMSGGIGGGGMGGGGATPEEGAKPEGGADPPAE